MERSRQVSVAILKPFETTWDGFLADVDRLARGVDDGENTYDESLDEEIEMMKRTFIEVAESLSVPIEIDDFEMQRRRFPNPLPEKLPAPQFSSKRSKFIESSHVIATIDPPPALMGYMMECVRANPLLRLLLNFTRRETLDDLQGFLSNVQTPIPVKTETGTTVKAVPRAFGAFVGNMRNVQRGIEQALLFPLCRSFDSTRPTARLDLPSMREATDDFREKYLEDPD